MTPRTYLQSIVDAISTFNITQLTILLHDHRTYQDTTKEIFIEKLGEIFDSLKTNGDTILVYQKGVCDSTGCPNKGCRGYRFIGNQTGSYIDIIFEIKDEDVTDIYDCTQFVTINTSEGLNNKESIDITVDEKASFNKTPSYWANLAEALVAYEEMITSPPRVLSLEDLQYWLHKHRITFDAIGGYDLFMPIMKWHKFAELYNELNELNDVILQNETILNQATNQIQKIFNEDAAINWLIEHFALNEKLPPVVKYGYFNDAMEEKDSELNDMLFEDTAFDVLHNFSVHYDLTSAELLRKYGIYTIKEQFEVMNSTGIHDYSFLHSIKYHLDKRKELLNMGIELPLYLFNSTENTDEMG
jgi:hypothetical protein